MYLQYLFHCDQVVYTVVPVDGLQGLEQAYLENAEGVNFILHQFCLCRVFGFVFVSFFFLGGGDVNSFPEFDIILQWV